MYTKLQQFVAIVVLICVQNVLLYFITIQVNRFINKLYIEPNLIKVKPTVTQI
jgi:hypothetical protein